MQKEYGFDSLWCTVWNDTYFPLPQLEGNTNTTSSSGTAKYECTEGDEWDETADVI